MDRLPVLEYTEQIIATVAKNKVTIIVADTGAGKSTQVPQMLAYQGLSVVVTEPRRLAARTLAARVASEVGCALGGLVGYRTAFERRDSHETQLLFCTDGLELVREIHGRQMPDVVIVDEVHEWNVNMEVLLAWLKRQIAGGLTSKVVIMSATLEAEKLSAYFGGAPVVDVPGRLFPVEERDCGNKDLAATALELAQDGRNVLVFVPGKKEIHDVMKDVDEESVRRGIRCVTIPLHGELTPEEQDAAFAEYDYPKVVVSTNVAQTSVTIPDIDAVVDSCLENRIETMNGVECLRTGRTSKADSKQRAGRAGRCKPGVYVSCYEGIEAEPDFPKPEIQRVRLDQLVLRLALDGFDATELEFFHQPDIHVLEDAKRLLRLLGAMDAGGRVTEIGRAMAKLPVSVEFARMLVEAETLGVTNAVITIAACVEVGGIADRQGGWEHLTQETASDLIAQLTIYEKMHCMYADALRKNGIHPKSLYRAKEIRKKLMDVISDNGRNSIACGSDRAKIVRACVAGFVGNLYALRCGYVNVNDKPASFYSSVARRNIGRGSVLDYRRPEFVIGVPLDIVKPGVRPLALLTMVTAVSMELLAEAAPHLIRKERRGFRLVETWEGVDETQVTFDETIYFNEKYLVMVAKTVDWSEIAPYLPEGKTAEGLKNELTRPKPEPEKLMRIPERFPGCAALKPKGPAADPVVGEWEDTGKRWWKCPRGHSVRAAKGATAVTCTYCHAMKELGVAAE